MKRDPDLSKVFCEACRFWHKDPAYRGECHYDPPRRSKDGSWAEWPKTDNNGWCGKGEAKLEAKA